MVFDTTSSVYAEDQASLNKMVSRCSEISISDYDRSSPSPPGA